MLLVDLSEALPQVRLNLRTPLQDPRLDGVAPAYLILHLVDQASQRSARIGAAAFELRLGSFQSGNLLIQALQRGLQQAFGPACVAAAQTQMGVAARRRRRVPRTLGQLVGKCRPIAMRRAKRRVERGATGRNRPRSCRWRHWFAVPSTRTESRTPRQPDVVRHFPGAHRSLHAACRSTGPAAAGRGRPRPRQGLRRHPHRF
mmetsp:Transcript_54711/g.166248  ORF Transcript_54711/g.166248 Transcript_54711/m.166248 type:complete len:202 (+) Transcript_54711:926-1531(+)